MEYGPPETFGRVTFCDDIRNEVDGKVTLVGCYGADMVFPYPFPVLLPKLGLAVQFAEKTDAKSEALKLEIFFPGDPDDTPSIAVDVPPIEVVTPPEVLAQRDDDTRKMGSINLILSPVNILSEGQIRVRIAKGDSKYRIGKIRVSTAAAKLQTEAKE